MKQTFPSIYPLLGSILSKDNEDFTGCLLPDLNGIFKSGHLFVLG
jgi:hypothetical protein